VIAHYRAADWNGAFRGVKKAEKLTFTITGKGAGEGSINGTMAFDRKDYGMNSGIPLSKSLTASK
jgi:polyisoprenoid-binding protein YceI